MSIDEANILSARAKTFLEHAEEASRKREYDFASFTAEQASQLFIKSAMLRVIGEIPKTHRTREMLALLSKSVPDCKELILKFIEKNRQDLRILDDAYISSRYMPTKYTRYEAMTLITLAHQISHLMQEVVKQCRR